MKSTGIIAMLVGAALVAPLVYLEFRYAMKIHSSFPFALFEMLWLVAAACVFVAAPILRVQRAGESLLGRPGVLVARVSFLVMAVLFWSGIVHDQMACFPGTPNCD